MDSNSHDKMRPVVEAIKASWKDDPCWDLHEFDAEAEELPHLIPYQAELRQFAIDTRAKWDAEVKAAAVATIDAVVKRIVDRSEAETAAERVPVGLMPLIRSVAAEIHDLSVKLAQALALAGEAHDRLDRLPKEEGQ